MSIWDISAKKLTRECDIATAAASILRECFIKALYIEKVLYVENFMLWSKSPNGQIVFIKKLSGRNPNLSKRIGNRGKFKIKKGKLNLIMSTNKIKNILNLDA